MSAKVTLAFLHADSNALKKHWMNDAAARIATAKGYKPYIHCELVFADGNAYSIIANSSGVHKIDSKGFNRDEWEFLSLELGEEGVHRAQRFCDLAYANKCTFNWWGYTLSPVTSWSGSGRTYFCSELCAAALQAGGMRFPLPPESYIPAALYEFVRKQHTTHVTVHPRALKGDFSFEF